MNKQLESWIVELETTEDKQALGVLHTANDEFCCLGIACRLAVAAGVIEPPVKKTDIVDGGLPVDVYMYDGHHRVLPPAVLDWLGLVDENGWFPASLLPQGLRDELTAIVREKSGLSDAWAVENNDELTLVLLNDTGVPFRKIAEVIRAVEPGLTGGGE